MRKNQLHNIPVMKKERRILRIKATPAEIVLWKALRNRQLEGEKFRRQHSIGCFVIDFYCSNQKLSVELDGKIHLKPEIKEYDNERTEYLNNLGIRMIRFKNEEVFDNLDGVLEKIRNCFLPHPQPLS